MTTKDLINTNDAQVCVENELEELLQFAQHSKSANTLITYSKAWKSYLSFCAGKGYQILSPTKGSFELQLSLFLSHMSKNLKTSTLATYLAGIAYHYEEQGITVNLSHPQLKKVFQGIRNEKGVKPNQKSPLKKEHVKEIVDMMSVDYNDVLSNELTPSSFNELPFSPLDLRDRALLLVEE